MLAILSIGSHLTSYLLIRGSTIDIHINLQLANVKPDDKHVIDNNQILIFPLLGKGMIKYAHIIVQYCNRYLNFEALLLTHSNM